MMMIMMMIKTTVKGQGQQQQHLEHALIHNERASDIYFGVSCDCQDKSVLSNDSHKQIVLQALMR